MTDSVELSETQAHDDERRLPVRGLRVTVAAGPDRGKSLALEAGTYLVGKSPRCALVLTDKAVSKRHLELRVGKNAIAVRDLDSRNGTFLRGARITEVEVGDGASLTLGETMLHIAAQPAKGDTPDYVGTEFGGLYGSSIDMRRLYELLGRVAASDAIVLIEGETGSGKELCAEAIHAHSARASSAFVVCDLSAVQSGLIESELFGHQKGAFTGADRDRAGAFEQANGGTLFLDEIGELALDLQPRLLGAIERRRVRPLGSTRTVELDVRLVAATNRDLKEEVAAGRFREDLYHRVAVVRAKIPPLRERKDDVPMLAERFLAGRAQLSREAMLVLMEYDWPGNVRELHNALERALALGGTGIISPQMLGVSDEEVAGAAGQGFFAQKERVIAGWEKRYLHDLLTRADGKVATAARASGIERAYLHRLLKKHGISS